ncbi:hypothetical protein IW492_05780 [Enterococcus sp. BWB1-3]|uniref:hypothetical protein n=1 Tax=Enterococcus sp. BWB1-3 TaxID=2787713 RepID=UPI0019226F12|nr:hypothetical protein [Enterococcus sp. BWB1-3]MBL1228741.1 hypothetical protein [Enterococcus sp. BWB1-3]
MEKISKEEKEELERFKERRAAFNGQLSVKNVHNVPTQFPQMYQRIFHTDSLVNNIFCLNQPNYSDADETIVALYEGYLNGE